MSNNSNPTTIFRADVSEFKKNINAANDAIKKSKAEFEAASAGMDKWSDNAEGLDAKLKELATTIAECEKIEENYQKQLKTVSETKEKNAKAAEELEERLSELEKQGKKNTEEYKAYAQQLSKTRTAISANEKEEKNLEIRILKTIANTKKAKAEYEKYDKQLKDISDTSKDAVKETDELADKLDEVDDSARNAGDGFTVFKGIIADLGAEAIAKGFDVLKDSINSAADALIDYSVDSERSFDSFAKATGTAKEDMAEYEDAIKDIYGKNYGEGFEDIAESMIVTKQTFRDFDVSGIQNATEKALLLRDAFDFDPSDSLRAAKMMMDQFEISADDAFNLIAQGAEKGLNKNGDLLDVINEYSVHYKQAGVTAEGMFNSLMNGADSGAFSVDKLGDSFKEYNIRLKDGSESTKQALTDLGITVQENTADIEKEQKAILDYEKKIADLKDKIAVETAKKSEYTDKTKGSTVLKTDLNIEKYTREIEEYEEKLKASRAAVNNAGAVANTAGTSYEEFGRILMQGGDAAQDLYDQLDRTLFSMDDKLKQNEIGVALFGTTWEDMGAEGVRALLNVEGEIDNAVDAIGKIKEEAEDADIGTLFEGIKRDLQLGIIDPISQEATPVVKEFGKMLSDAIAGEDVDASAFTDSIDDMLTNLQAGAGESIKKIASSVGGVLMENAPVLLESGAQLLMFVLTGLVGAFPELVPAAVSMIDMLLSGIVGASPQILQAGVQIIMAIITGLVQAFPELVPVAVDLVVMIADLLMENADILLSGAVQLLMAIVSAVPILIEKLVPMIPDIVLTIIDVLLANVPALVDGAVTLFYALITAIPIIINALIPEIPTIVSTIINGLIDCIPDLTSGAVQLLMGIVMAVPMILTDLYLAIAGLGKDMIEEIGKINLLDAGVNLIDGLIEGILGGAGRVGDAIATIGESIINTFTSIFDINSPSKLMELLAGYLPDGAAEGIRKRGANAIESMKELARNMLAEFDLSDMGDRLKELSVLNVGNLKTVNKTAGNGSQDVRTSYSDSHNVTYSPTFHYNKPLSAKETYRQNKNVLKEIVGAT